MKKLICFAFLAFFLAVSAVSTSHAADYPSDAPLPRFALTKALGMRHDYPDSTYIMVSFEGTLTNGQEFNDWLAGKGMSPLGLLMLHADHHYMSVRSGAIENDHPQFGYELECFGKWNMVAFSRVDLWDSASSQLYYIFEQPLYFCDVYIPLPSDMTPDVWTDLQFTQANQPIIPNEMLIPLLVACVMAVGVVVAVSKKKS